MEISPNLVEIRTCGFFLLKVKGVDTIGNVTRLVYVEQGWGIKHGGLRVSTFLPTESREQDSFSNERRDAR